MTRSRSKNLSFGELAFLLGFRLGFLLEFMLGIMLGLMLGIMLRFLLGFSACVRMINPRTGSDYWAILEGRLYQPLQIFSVSTCNLITSKSEEHFEIDHPPCSHHSFPSIA